LGRAASGSGLSGPRSRRLGWEAWFEELASLVSGPEPPSLEQLFEAGRRYDSIFMPELAPPLIKKYGRKLGIPGGKS
jgi:hypothetical protein